MHAPAWKPGARGPPHDVIGLVLFSFFQDKQSTPRALSLCVEETHRYLSLHLLLDAFPRFRRSAGALCLHRQRWLHRTGCFAVVEINAEDVNITTIRVGRNKEGRDQNSQCGGRWRACIYSGAARGSPRCSKARPQPQRYKRARCGGFMFMLPTRCRFPCSLSFVKHL